MCALCIVEPKIHSVSYRRLFCFIYGVIIELLCVSLTESTFKVVSLSSYAYIHTRMHTLEDTCKANAKLNKCLRLVLACSVYGNRTDSGFRLAWISLWLLMVYINPY